VQGIAWDSEGRLWATEHGRSGVQSGFDDLNLIEKGHNYGWPEIEGSEKRERMEAPKLHSGPTTTWAPASALYCDNSIFFGGLRGEALYEALLDEGGFPLLQTHFKGTFGRIRAVALGPDGMLYLATMATRALLTNCGNSKKTSPTSSIPVRDMNLDRSGMILWSGQRSFLASS
jgi:glucose/arabinose dehydrogenase